MQLKTLEKNKRILITGASGFIGSNLLQYYIEKGNTVINIDNKVPQNKKHNKYWENVDITNLKDLEQVIFDFDPEYVIHLAARTDLEGKNIEDYSANVEGVRNLVNILKSLNALKRVVFASSQLVCYGRMPLNDYDYNPDNLYGESKVIGEKIVSEDNNIKFEYAFVRPTSIWGPWFGIPYRNFFDMVINKRYFHIGNISCTKTYGYIDNTIYQIDQILESPSCKINRKVFYLGDYKPYSIEEWANEIAELLNSKVLRVPYVIIYLLAKFGDILKLFNMNFPMSTFRLKNMTTNNIIDMSKTISIAPNLPVKRIIGIKKTLEWISKNNKQ
jgi:nucleoside-diphosphate-sugar epimerase